MVSNWVLLERDSHNLKSVVQNPQLAMEKISKEIKFSEKPILNMIISPIGLIPKSEPGKFRLIQHLSFPDGSSVNDGIDLEVCKVKYATFFYDAQMVVRVGKLSALMAKVDIESAFRLLPVHPEDFQLLGIKVDADEIFQSGNIHIFPR